MKRKTLLIVAVVGLAVVVLTYLYPVLSFLLLAVLILALVFLLFVGIVTIFKSSIKPGWYRIPVYVIIIAVFATGVSMLKPLPPPLPQENTSVSKTLKYMHQTDQADRKNTRMYFNLFVLKHKKMIKRDSIRLHKTLALLKNDTVKLDPVDQYRAAMILQHGKKPEHYKMAHELATQAAKHDIQNAEWLKKATYDRWQLSIGNEQKYGTQYGIEKEKQ